MTAPPASPAAAPAAPTQPAQRNWLGEFGMGVADSFGVSHLFQKETWVEAGQGLNMLVTDPGRAARILGEEFKNNIGDPAMRGLNYAIQNPAGAANILKDEAAAAAQSFKTNIIDKSIAGARFLFTDPVGAGQVLVDSPRELGQIAGTAAGVALDAASGGGTRAARMTGSVAGEVAETAVTQSVRQLTPNPGALVDAAIPNAPSPRIGAALADQVDAVPPRLPAARPEAPVAGAHGPRPSAAAGDATLPGPAVREPATVAPTRASPAITGDVTVRPGDRVSFPAGSQLGDMNIHDIAGGGVVTHRAELPLAGRSADEIASQVAAQTPGYSRFTHPSTPAAGPVRGPAASVGPDSQMGDLTINRVAGGSIGDFEFDFTRGSGAALPSSPPAAARPPAAPSTRPPAAPEVTAAPASSSVVNFSGTTTGDVRIGDVAGRNIVDVGVHAPDSVMRHPEVQAAGRELMETLREHAAAMPQPPRPSSPLVDIGAGTQMGDVTIGDVAGGHILEVNVRLPSDVTPSEAANILRGLREGLEQAYQQGEASTRTLSSARYGYIVG